MQQSYHEGEDVDGSDPSEDGPDLGDVIPLRAGGQVGDELLEGAVVEVTGDLGGMGRD